MSDTHKDQAINEQSIDIHASTHLDACGLFCPEPVMLLHNKVRDMAVGEVVEVVATDPSTTRDIPKFCLFLGHDLVSRSEKDGRYYYLIRKQ